VGTDESSTPLSTAARAPRTHHRSGAPLLAITLVLLMIVIGGWIWARSGNRVYLIYFTTSWSFVFDVHPKGLCLAVGRQQGKRLSNHPGNGLKWEAMAVDPQTQYVSEQGAKLGFATQAWEDGWYGQTRSFQIPHWAIALPVVVVLAWQIRRRMRRHIPGTCQFCGYDLRATPERCPECGTAPATHT
jgi:hypothetical protein